MNYRTAQVFNAAPVSNILRVLGIYALFALFGLATVKKLGLAFAEVGWETFGVGAIVAFVVFLIGRVRLGMINGKFERQFENTQG